jgi:hypothetical protein
LVKKEGVHGQTVEFDGLPHLGFLGSLSSTSKEMVSETPAPGPKSGHQLLGEYRQELRRRQAAGQPPAPSMLPDAIPDERAALEETA